MIHGLSSPPSLLLNFDYTDIEIDSELLLLKINSLERYYEKIFCYCRTFEFCIAVFTVSVHISNYIAFF